MEDSALQDAAALERGQIRKQLNLSGSAME